ncbi:MAG: SpoIVB peptidase [Clostridia bacterium]|nr:SpoIVB peptidase [Clostridia bacterium]
MNSRRSKKIIAVLTAAILSFAICASFVGNVSAVSVENVSELIPGGMAFGVKFFTEGALVLGTTGVETASGMVTPAKDAGLRAGDIIIRAGGSEFESANELISIISGCAGKPIVVAYMRDGVEEKATVNPARDIENGTYRIGVLVRDSTAGIGTVTFIDPQTRDFGGLGHGIYDSETGTLLPLGRGAVVQVDINGVQKSERNSPGALKGKFGRVSIGELWDNCDEGVFGRLTEIPDTAYEPMPIASRDELAEGKAKILTTLSGNQIEEYEIEIEHIYSKSGSTKNFLIKVTDDSLIEKTGGIVQGMSGSPIIKDGKIIGAVTHVLIDDPLHGYGICIENMLHSAFDVDIDETEYPLAA